MQLLEQPQPLPQLFELPQLLEQPQLLPQPQPLPQLFEQLQLFELQLFELHPLQLKLQPPQQKIRMRMMIHQLFVYIEQYLLLD